MMTFISLISNQNMHQAKVIEIYKQNILCCVVKLFLLFTQ
jgi:hypothetical protein